MRKFLQRLSLTTTALVLAGVSLGIPLTSAAFNQNLVIDDVVFNNTGTMNGASIDAFLNAQPNSCISPNSGFRARVPSGYTPSGGFTYGGFGTAGEVIAISAGVYGLNPQVLIVTLQKEQSLVTGGASYCNNGDEHKYAAAMGYGCPDSGGFYNWSGVSLYMRNGVEHTSTGQTCVNSASKAGFSQQTIRAAWLLKFGQQRSLGNTGWAVVTGSWDNSDDPPTCYGGPMTQGVLSRGCGQPATFYDGYTTIDGTAVHMDSGATAAMYWYTPHFHGNQNFVNLFEGWFGPTIAGGISLDRGAGSPVALSPNAGGPLQLVGVADNDSIYTKRQSAPSSSTWGGWSPLPGGVRNIAAETNSDGRIQLVGIANNGSIYTSLQAAQDSTSWSAWTPMDGGLTGAALARNYDGSLEIFGVANTGAIYYRRQATPGGSWGAWAQLPGALSRIAADTNTDGRIQLVGVASNGNIYHTAQTSVSTDTWPAWTQMDGGLTNVSLARNFGTGTMEVFGIAGNGGIYYRRQASAGSSSWASWKQIPGALRSIASEYNSDGRIQLVGIAGNGNIYYTSQTAVDTDTWSNWTQMDGALRKH